MQSKLTFEAIILGICFLVTALVLAPIYLSIGDDYPFYFENGIFVFVFMFFMSYLFLLRFHWFAHLSWPKVIMIFAVIPLLLYLVDNVYDFQSFLDQEGIYSILDKLNGKNQGGYAKYIKSEMMFFWAGAFITSLLIPIRMIVSLWRMRHRNTV